MCGPLKRDHSRIDQPASIRPADGIAPLLRCGPARSEGEARANEKILFICAKFRQRAKKKAKERKHLSCVSWRGPQKKEKLFFLSCRQGRVAKKKTNRTSWSFSATLVCSAEEVATASADLCGNWPPAPGKLGTSGEEMRHSHKQNCNEYLLAKTNALNQLPTPGLTKLFVSLSHFQSEQTSFESKKKRISSC